MSPRKYPSLVRRVETTKSPATTGRVKANDVRIHRALELIQPGSQVQIAEVAAALNLSLSGFRHLFKKEVGTAPGQYLKIARLELANELLRSSFLRVKEITSLIGANDVSHFVRNYKRFYRETPSQTRRRQRSGLQPDL